MLISYEIHIAPHQLVAYNGLIVPYDLDEMWPQLDKDIGKVVIAVICIFNGVVVSK